MTTHPLDYDRIAPTYDRRFTTGQRDGTTATLLNLVDHIRPRSVLEVGCGTGHWLAEMAGNVPQVFGLDLSRGMLAKARQRGAAVHFTNGRAEDLPYRESSFDLVYCVNALHHFRQPARFVQEAARILMAGGQLAVIGMSPPRSRDEWYVYQYFEGTFELDQSRFPSWGTVLDWAQGAGFETAAWRIAESIHNELRGYLVFQDPFLEKNSTSQLAVLSDEAYRAGLERIRTALEHSPNGEEMVFSSDIALYILIIGLPGK